MLSRITYLSAVHASALSNIPTYHTPVSCVTYQSVPFYDSRKTVNTSWLCTRSRNLSESDRDRPIAFRSSSNDRKPNINFERKTRPVGCGYGRRGTTLAPPLTREEARCSMRHIIDWLVLQWNLIGYTQSTFAGPAWRSSVQPDWVLDYYTISYREFNVDWKADNVVSLI